MTSPELQPSRTGTLLHGSTRFCADSSSKLFHERPRFFQSSHSKNQGNHLAKLKILNALFAISSSAHNLVFGILSSSVGSVRFFSTNEEPEKPNQIPNSEELLLLAAETQEVLSGMMKHMNQLSDSLLVLGVVQLGTWIHLFSSPLVEIQMQCLLTPAIPICAALAFRRLSSMKTEEEYQGFLILWTLMVWPAMGIETIAHMGLGMRIMSIMHAFVCREYLMLALSAIPVTLLLSLLFLVSFPPRILARLLSILEGAVNLPFSWRLQLFKKLDRLLVQSRLGVYFIACTQLIIWSTVHF